MVKGNGDRLYQLVMILGDNAIKYSPDRGVIKFGVFLNEKQEPVLTVQDQGYGIPQEDIPYIWERFYKVDKSHSRNIPGTGLGLAIGKEIIRLHGAKVIVKSEIGKGTCFEVTFKMYRREQIKCYNYFCPDFRCGRIKNISPEWLRANNVKKIIDVDIRFYLGCNQAQARI